MPHGPGGDGPALGVGGRNGPGPQFSIFLYRHTGIFLEISMIYRGVGSLSKEGSREVYPASSLGTIHVWVYVSEVSIF